MHRERLIKVHLLDALGRLVFSMLRLLSAVRFASKLVKPKHHCYASCHVALCISFTTKIPVDQSCLFWLPCERGLPVSIGPAGRPFSISARGALFQFPIGPQDFDKAKSEDHRKGQLPTFLKSWTVLQRPTREHLRGHRYVA